MNSHGSKKIAPIIITVIFLLYYILYFGVIILMVPGIFKVMLGVIPLLLGGVMIYVCVERIREIDGGEEDDLSKY